MAKLSQREVVVAKLESEGEVSNVWAFQNFILRLGAIIHDLRKSDWVIDTEMRGPNKKVCFYKLIKKPE